MKTNPIYKLNGSGLSLGNIYSLTLTNDGNGSVYSVASIGTNGYTTTLSAIPSAGYQFSAFSADYGTINGNEYTFTTKDAVVSAFFEEHTIPIFSETTINGVTWTIGIINIDDGLSGIDKRTDVTVNGHNFGDVYYYNFDAAQRIANLIEGYHLPTKTETDAMVNYCGGYNSSVANKLKSTLYWSIPGTDIYGFGAIPLGMIDRGNATFGNESTFWNDNNGSTNRMYITNSNRMANGTENQNNYKYPLRLVKD